MKNHTFTTEVEDKYGFIYEILGSIDYEIDVYEEDAHPDLPTSKYLVVKFQAISLKIEKINSLQFDFFTQKFIEYINPLLIKELQNNHTSDLIELEEDLKYDAKNNLNHI